ncbi:MULTISPECIES: SgcJ/EcaC family oxidoreductase [Altibacter]|uniref:SgcJ/EcaC family oxidoreductase n=1 Tax=Altibacter TaxID=1535231 RepID=UPI00068C8EC7|nr:MULTISPECIES: SgcJ/EcaC family oxidoreductase [Altibacter]MCW9038742.1 SgcJ/EcaC family oxidoreductase [Altibacter sp.]
MKKIIFILSVVLCTSSLIAQNEKDEKEIKNLIATLQKGWNSGSGHTFASTFAEPHDFIVWTGYYFKNNTVERNAESHQRIFSTMYKDTQLFYTVDKIKFLSNEIALMHVLAAVAPKNETRPKDPQVLISVIAQKIDGTWKIVSFHNLDLESFQQEEIKKGSPIPPSVMYASWYDVSK